MPTDDSIDETPGSALEWSDAELTAAVEAYVGMLRLELDGLPYVKSEVNLKLREGELATRTKASVEFRMQNISATLVDLRMPRITGYLPAKNVGNSVKDRIKKVLVQVGVADLENYVPTSDRTALERRVTALRSRPLGTVPVGSAAPEQQSTTTTTFVRDPAVKRWVLDTAKGVCEGCDTPAPFIDLSGLPFLEVHHVMPLVSKGSDTVWNAVALCPNCHRRCHLSLDRDEFKLALYEKIKRLRIEVPGHEDIGNSEFINVK
ncbi:MAG: HNH endonuclease [Pseudomonadota bacterium]